MSKKEASDPRFHYEMWVGPTSESDAHRSPIYYVENHNGQCGYNELATDFEMAAWLAIERLELDGLGNWTAPIAHLVRQTIELLLKSMVETVTTRGCPVDPRLNFSHDLQKLWLHSRTWLTAQGYKFEQDARLERAELLVEALHQIDPSGDLFRFGISNRTAYGNQKSYDRVGLHIDILRQDFSTTAAFLRHWEAVLFREKMAIEMGWEADSLFNADDFPRKRP